MHNGLAKTGFAARTSTRSSFRRLRSATLMRFNTRRPTFQSLVVLYGKISRIRAISSPKVLAAAEQVLRRIADIYFEPPIVLSRDQIRSMLRDGSVDILRDFSQTCRAEFEMLRCPTALKRYEGFALRWLS